MQEIETLDGYVLDDTIYTVDFVKQDNSTKLYTYTLDLQNLMTSVEFSKVDVNNNNIEDCILELYQVSDNKETLIDTWITTKESHVIKGLKVNNKYILKEKSSTNEFVISKDIEFTVNNTTDTQNIVMTDKQVEISKVDIAGKEIPGATLQVLDKNGNVVDEWVSSTEVHKVSNLTEGETYILHEEICVEGFVKATDIEFTVTEDKETQKIEMVDKIVSMTKTDIGGNEIEGAEMTVTNEVGEVVDSWVSTKEPHHISGLEENKKYVLHEIYAPSTFVIATDVEFTVTADKETQEIILVDKVVEMSKVDIGGNEIEGAEMTVTNEEGEIVDSWVSTKESHRISGLEENKKYILHELYAPDSFTIASDIEFVVTTDKETQTIVMIDKIVEIVKTDLVTGEELPGAELEVKDEEGNIIDKWTSTDEPHRVKGLEEGKKYILTEVTCPYGFEQAESIIFEVSTDKKTQIIEMKDMPILSNIKVIKIDSETKETIKAKFTFGLYADEECTELIQEVESDKELGSVLFENLRFNTFYIKELLAPKRI